MILRFYFYLIFVSAPFFAYKESLWFEARARLCHNEAGMAKLHQCELLLQSEVKTIFKQFFTYFYIFVFKNKTNCFEDFRNVKTLFGN